MLGRAVVCADNTHCPMWPFKKRIRQRRLEVRKNIPPQRQNLWRRFVALGGPANMAIAIGFLAVVVVLVIFPNETFPHRVGEVEAKRYARVEFEAPNESRTIGARNLAERLTPWIYVSNEALLLKVKTDLASLPAKLKDVTDAGKIPPQLREQFGLHSVEDVVPLREFADEGKDDQWRQAVEAVTAELGRKVILSRKDYSQVHQAMKIRMESPGGEVLATEWLGDLTIMADDQPKGLREGLTPVLQPLAPSVRQTVLQYLVGVIHGDPPGTSGQPTYTKDAARTRLAISASRADVPEAKDPYAADSVIFGGGEVTPAAMVVLRAEYQAYRRWLKRTDPNRDLRAAGGRTVMALLVVLAMCVYIARYQRRIVENHGPGLGMAALLLLMLSLAKIIAVVAGWNVYLTVGLAVMGGIIITIAYNQRFALAVGCLLAMLLTILLRQDVGFLLTAMASVAVSILLLKEIRTRSKVIEVGAIAAMTAFLATVMTRLALGSTVNAQLIIDGAWATGSVIAVGFVVQGVLPVIERFFGIATSMTLLEWCDANKRLLKRLAIEAPGTYNHSLLLGTLCETAAEAIGARGLLARVGAYYHDIGKINKPEYFVENQFGSPSKHAKLSPAMSLLIITGHVKDGIEMAKEYGLPPVLRKFIATHHGTTLVQYFYHAAAEQRKANGTDRAPDEVEFRYPGPKPREKEAAILMLADAAESSVRAMADPTPGRIETQAHAMVSARLMDGQLDDCDLTLRDVHLIEESLVKSLCGIYHGRVAYPTSETKPHRRGDQEKAGA